MTRLALTMIALVGLTALSACGRSHDPYSYDQPQTRSLISPSDVWVVGGYR